MNDLLQQLHKIVPSFNVASIPKDATGVFASPVHIIAGLIDVTPVYIQKIINHICANVNANCTMMKVTVNGTERRNRIMVGDANTIMGILASCDRDDMRAIIAKLPAVAPVPRAPAVAPTRPQPSVAPAPQAPSVSPAPQAPTVAPAPQAPTVAPVLQAPVVTPAVQAPTVAPARPPPSVAFAIQAPTVAMDVDGASADDLQDDDAMTIKDHFDFVPAQMMEFELKLVDGSDFVVPVRRDGYVNVTKICQAAGKRLDNWIRLDSSKESMEYLQKTLDDEHAANVKLRKAIPHIRGITLLSSCKGGNINAVEQGTFAHPDLAIIIAMWANKKFAFQVFRWIRELMITGCVELGKEKSGPELKQKLEETFQAVDEDTKAFLREKHCLELSLLRIKCAADEEEKKDRAAKRQRDDAAAEEERAAKRQRDDYDNAKRQREDAAASDKAKEESRMQLVLFNAEMATKAKMSVEDLNLKRLECAKSLVEFNAKCLPLLTNSLKESSEKNVLLRSAMSDIEVNLVRKINKCISGDDSESPGYQETLYCNDIQTFLREMGRPMASTEELKKIGVFVSNKYYENFKIRPEKTMKIVNNTNCQVNAYRIEHKDFVERCIREFFDQATTLTNAAAPDVPVAKPSKDVRFFFGPFNGVNCVNNK